MRRGDKGNDEAQQEIRRLRRAVMTLSACNRALLRSNDEPSLLAEICRIIVREGGYRLAWVSRAEHDAQKTVTPLAWAGIDEGFVESLRVTWADTERGQGVTGTAIRSGEPSIVRDLSTDPKVALWREAALQRGYASTIGFPLRVDGEVFGALSIAAPEPDAFDEQELDLLGEAAANLAYGMGMLRTRAKADEAEATIRSMAYYDTGLTGLPNRVLLRERMEQAIAEARQRGTPLAFLRVGIDNFRDINETLSYDEGDRLLTEVTGRLTRVAGPADVIARVGDEEFALLLPKGGAEHARRAAEKILVLLNEPVELSGLAFEIRAHIGITLFPGHGTNPDTLIRRANVALYHAKRDSAGYAFYTGGLEEEHKRRLALMYDLRNAIENSEVVLHCQPKVHIATRRLSGAEALVRWQHPQYGTINPAEFIKLAESAGFITPLTYWVLDAALARSYAWRESGFSCPLAVNLAARDLHDPRLIDRIKGSFATWGAAPDWIQFELTEGALMQDPAGALNALRRLKDLGVQLFIDDFGTGYSSLSYLQKLPIDTIKIDQSFVMRMCAETDSHVIVGSTIELAHNLDLGVVAEGVESEEVWSHLATLGCDFAQGYAVAAPMPANEFRDWEAASPWH
jgi:diguanylate cyclase (GGDEF)-like protein